MEYQDIRYIFRLFNVPTGGAHPCNTLCMFATGPNCECKCGGRNHGAGDLCATQTIELFADLEAVGA
jgi:hypothetical protein